MFTFSSTATQVPLFADAFHRPFRASILVPGRLLADDALEQWGTKTLTLFSLPLLALTLVTTREKALARAASLLQARVIGGETFCDGRCGGYSAFHRPIVGTREVENYHSRADPEAIVVVSSFVIRQEVTRFIVVTSLSCSAVSNGGFLSPIDLLWPPLCRRFGVDSFLFNAKRSRQCIPTRGLSVTVTPRSLALV